MLIPLGLNSKLFRLPIMTLLIVVFAIAASFREFRSVDELNKIYLSSETHLHVVATRLKIVAEVCVVQQVFTAAECRHLDSIAGHPIYSLLGPSSSFGDLLKKQGKTDKQIAPMTAKLNELLLENKKFDKTVRPFAEPADAQMLTSAEAAFAEERQSFMRPKHLLSKETQDLKSLLLANFIHGGLMHLFGNLLFFIFIAMHVEQRMGSLLFGVTYLLTGICGYELELLFIDDPARFVLGASASIAGIAGAYTILFWRQKMRVLYFAGVYRKIFQLPVAMFFPVLVFTADLIAVMQASGGGVAHFAHLGGFAMGCLAGFALKKMQNLPDGVIFPQETKLIEDLRQVPVPKGFKERFEVLDMNPENSVVHHQILASVGDGVAWNTLSKPVQYYFLNYFSEFAQRTETDPSGQFLNLVQKAAPDWPLAQVFKTVSPKALIANLDYCLTENKNAYGALVIYNVLFAVNPRYRKNFNLTSGYNELLKQYREQKDIHESAA